MSFSPESPLFILETQIRELFGRVAYSHKTHEKCADLYLQRLGQVKTAQIALSALTAGSFIVDIIGKGHVGTVIGTVLSTVLLALNTYTKDFDLGEIAQKHSDTASKLWGIRESYLSLLTDLRTGSLDLAQGSTKRDELKEELEAIYQGAPRTNSKAYGLAQTALKDNEELTFSEKEIDDILPSGLRRGNAE